MARIFLDIGAHIGESIEIASSKRYTFTRIIAIEPSSYCHKYLEKYRDPRIEIHKIGLGNQNRTANLFGAGSVGASLFLEKPPYWSTCENITISKFSDWYKRNIDRSDEVFIKINIEGAEIEIVPELKLIDTSGIKSILISFDIEKIPSLSPKKQNLVEVLSKYRNIQFMERTKDFGVKEWLNNIDEINRKGSFLHSILRPDIPLSRNIRRMLKPLIPRSVWLILALKYGPNKRR